MKPKLLFLLLCFSSLSFSQEKDTLTVEKEKKLELKLHVVSRYVWRGQCWGADYVAVQPTIEYAVTPKLSFVLWATTNFKSDYFYPDSSFYKGYQEVDFYVTYQFNDFLQLQLWDYYWPSVSKVAGVD